MKYLLIPLLMLLALPIYACRTLTYEEQREIFEAEYNLEKKFVQSLISKSDTIIIAKVTKVAERKQSEENNLTKYFDVDLELKKTIKGKLEGKAYWKETDKESLKVSCNIPLLNNSVHVYKSYQYLIYLKNGEILRASSYGQPFPILNENEEMELIKSHDI